MSNKKSLKKKTAENLLILTEADKDTVITIIHQID
jgi:hypothetical protein